MKKFDKFIYVTMMVLGIMVIVSIFYYIIYFFMSFINSSDFANVLIDLNIYSIFYNILNAFSKLAFPLIIFAILLAIPYLVICIIIAINYILKYVKYKGKKKIKIIKTAVLFIVLVLLLGFGIYSFPLTNQYEIKVNSYVSDVSNTSVRNFLQDELNTNYYVYKIKFIQGFPDDYNAYIYYKDGFSTKVERTFMSDSNYDFIENNAENLTDSLMIKSLVLLLLGNLLYIYFLVYILKEYKRIVTISS